MQSIEIKTTQNVSIEYELASLRDRILAFLIDLIILMSTFSIILMFVFAAIASTIGDDTAGILVGLMPVLGFMAYQFLSELLSDGQSLGKKAMNIKVVRLDGRQPNVSDYLLRAVFHLVDTIFSAGVLSALVISTSHKRQRLGDMTANTTVIRTRSNTDFRLADILRINSLEDYQPTYPEVKVLNDEDMLLIKNILRRQSIYPNQAHEEAMQQLISKLSQLLGINAPARGQEVLFLKTLLKDYIVLTR